MCIRSADLSKIFCAGALMLVAFDATMSTSRAQGYPSAFVFGEPASEQDIAEVISERILEAEHTCVDRPGDVAQQQRLLTREGLEEDLREAREQRGLVVELGVREQHRRVVEVDEAEGQRARMERETQRDEREHG